MAERVPMLLRVYRLVSAALGPLAPSFLRRRVLRGKEDPKRLNERYGETRVARPQGPLVWFHGASVGELLAIIPLVERVHEQGFAVLCTSGTVTSATLAAERLPKGVIHQYVPLDVPQFVQRFLDHWKPDLALFVESDLWPNLITTLAKRGVPLLMVNGRLSERSFHKWRYMPGTAAALLTRFDLCMAQSPTHAERYRDLGAPRITTTGNLKLDVPEPPADGDKLAALQDALAGRVVLAAASTHSGEETILVEAHKRLRKTFPQLITLIAPRHPERGDNVAEAASSTDLSVVLRTRGGLPGPRTDIYVADTLGELGLIYRVAPIVFVGGSLVKHGGQNPIEPIKLGAAVLHGPDVWNFAEIYEALKSAGGTVEVRDAADLVTHVSAWLSKPSERDTAVNAARDAVDRLGGALERTLTALDPYLMQLRIRQRGSRA